MAKEIHSYLVIFPLTKFCLIFVLIKQSL